MRRIIFRVGVIFAAMVFWIVAAVLPSGAILPTALLSVIFIEAIRPQRLPLLWMSALAFFGEILSPYPPLVLSAAFICAALIGVLMIRAYFSNRAILGAALCALLTIVLFEALIFLFSSIMRTQEGWIPVWSLGYVWFVGFRMLGSALILSAALFFTQRISPRIKGVVLSSNW